MTKRLLLLPLLATLAAGESRAWRNADGSASFDGEYISQADGAVTIRRADGKEFTMELARLHPEDRAWLAAADRPPDDPAAAFDTLRFGDSRQAVETKLKRSEVVEPVVEGTFLGRFGLNGTFRTKNKIGGLCCELYFDWTEDGALKEISLQSEALGEDGYATRLRENWLELAGLLAQLHGKPLQAGAYPKSGGLEDDMFLGSHLWRLADGGSALLGTSMQKGRYLVMVRFTTEKIEPVRVP